MGYGVSHNTQHFTGKRAGKSKRRKGATRKQRSANRGSHKNKYE